MGKRVYKRVAYCVTCHGWTADCELGRNPVSHAVGARLRESQPDKEGPIETIKCGRPGTQMPHHDRAAYRDDRCCGMVTSDFAPGSEPTRGKILGDQDVANVVAYLPAHVIANREDGQDYIARALEVEYKFLEAGASAVAHPVNVSLLVDPAGVVQAAETSRIITSATMIGAQFSR